MDALRNALAERFTLLSEVGQGAMARVFHAHDRRFDRPVAIKMLREELGASVSAERFSREIETAARLQHPHILPIYDSGAANGLHFYVMPLVNGESLRSRLARDGALPWSDALRITGQVADALAYAHARLIVHRNIKPENILLHQGHAMVADFGIAKALAGSQDLSLTLADNGIGTPAYMSPEQAFGEGTLDGRADLYSLACTLYEMIEGRTPFSGTTLMAILVEKTTGIVRSLHAARTRVPTHIDEVLKRALAQDPNDRFAAVGEFVSALHAPEGIVESPQPRTPRTLAVLPFANLGNDREDEFLSDGITEDLTHALAGLGGLRLAGRTSAFTFKGRPVDARDAGASLGVDAVLDGSLRRRGDRLRIVVHLTDVRTGFELWSERFDREFTDMFDVQDEITRSIVETLRVRLAPSIDRLVSTPTSNMEAYEAYLRGRAAWNDRTIPSMHRAVGYMERAMFLDPGFALAHAGLADCHVTLALYGDEAPNVAMPAAERACEAAQDLQQGLPEALTARASINALYHWDWKAAEHDFLLAIRHGASPTRAHHWYAMHLLAPQGRLDEAARNLELARQLDPLSPVLEASIGIVHLYARRTDDAIAVLDKLRVDHPQFGLARHFRAQVLTTVGRHEEAVEEMTAAVALAGESTELLTALGVAYSASGQRDRAFELLERVRDTARQRYVSPVLLAQFHSALGEFGEAILALDLAVKVRATDLTMLPTRPVFEPLHGLDGYREILKQLNLQPRR